MEFTRYQYGASTLISTISTLNTELYFQRDESQCTYIAQFGKRAQAPQVGGNSYKACKGCTIILLSVKKSR